MIRQELNPETCRLNEKHINLRRYTPDRHCENGSILWRDGKNHQNDVTTSYATASRCVTTVPFSWRDGQNHQMMWPPAMQQHPDHQLCNSIQVRHYGSISWRDGQNHQMMWPPAMQQHPGASLRFHFVARRTESPRAGTRYCVQYLIHQMSTASLARLGQMAPCPLRFLERERTEGRKREKFYICLDVTHTH